MAGRLTVLECLTGTADGPWRPMFKLQVWPTQRDDQPCRLIHLRAISLVAQRVADAPRAMQLLSAQSMRKAFMHVPPLAVF